MHPALRHFYYSSSRGGYSPLMFDSGATIAFTSAEASALPTINQVLTPQVLYVGGKTHFVYQEAGSEAGGAGRLVIITYDDRYGLGRPVGFIGKLGIYDNHHSPAIIHDNDNLYIAVEKDHNDLPISILKNRVSGDDFAWELSATTIGTVPTYPNLNLTKINGVLVNLCQFLNIEAGFNKNSSGDFEGVWSVEEQMTTRGVGEAEHYLNQIQNHNKVTDRVIFGVTGRTEEALPKWFNKYLIKMVATSSGVTYYNWDESFTKTSQLTAAELAANFRYYTTGASTKQGYIPVPALDASGNFYDVSGDGAGGYVFIYQMVGDATPTTKAVSLPSAPTILDGADIGADGQNGGCALILAISSSEVYAFFRIQSGLFGKIFMYKTTDLGDTWTDEGDVFVDIDADIYGFSCPINSLSIGNNKNFCFVGSSPGAPSYAALYFKKAAFGTVQSETGDPFDVTAYTEAEYNALTRRSYYIEAGKVTNTGTACTGLIDQSPSGQNATVAGSPTLDSSTAPTYATLDGVNDAFSIPVTGLTALTEGTIIVVAKGRTGVAANFLSASKNTVTDKFLLYGKSATEKTRFNDSNILDISGKTVVTDDFHIYAYVHQNGSCSVLQFIDGEFQLKDSTTRHENEGRFFDAMATLTHIEIGRLVRTTTGWYNFDIKHAAILDVTSREELNKCFKYLANRPNTGAGITLNSHFA